MSLIDASTCATIDKSKIPHDMTLASGAPDQVLAADALHEARLLPLLVRDGFDLQKVGTVAFGPNGTLAGWRSSDETSNGGISRWVIFDVGTPPARRMRQISDTGAVPVPDDPTCPGTLLLRDADSRLPAGHRDQPAQWTDVRVSAYVNGSGTGAVGLVFRHSAAGYYRFSIAHAAGRRRLVRVAGGVTTLLAEDARPGRAGVDALVTIEAVGSDLRVHQDGVPVFAVVDAALGAGGAGLYGARDNGVAFADFRVDDLREDAPAVYRFPFTTSRYASFAHQAHDRDDAAPLPQPLPASPALGAVPRVPLPTSAAPTVAEGRAFGELATAALGQPPGARRKRWRHTDWRTPAARARRCCCARPSRSTHAAYRRR